MKGHLEVQLPIDTKCDAGSFQSYGENLGASVVIMAVKPIDCRRIGKLDIAPNYHTLLKPLYQNGIDFSICQDNRVGLHTAASAIGDDQRKICGGHAIAIESR